MKLFASIILSAAVVLFSPASWSQAGGYQMCSAEIEEALAAALLLALGDVRNTEFLTERIDLNSPRIPDLGVLRHGNSIYVANLVRDAKCIVDGSVLPSSPDVTFTLVSEGEILELARQPENDGATYVSAGGVRLSENEVIVNLGVSIRPAPGDKRGLTCCCGGEMVLRHVSGKWLFERWRNVLCA
ncbi:MAG TPA: hypothetical protein VE907_14610 [Gammaproteobacteria bacterium]|nr:hypothetical protein [Gammaproteobacteria bacterium]